jgi:hypothetical protein
VNYVAFFGLFDNVTSNNFLDGRVVLPALLILALILLFLWNDRQNRQR